MLYNIQLIANRHYSMFAVCSMQQDRLVMFEFSCSLHVPADFLRVLCDSVQV